MARTRGSQLKQILLVVFVVAGIMLAVANWITETGSGSDPTRSYYQATPSSITLSTPTPQITAAPNVPSPTPTSGPSPTPFPTIED